jgi:putative membrane protein
MIPWLKLLIPWQPSAVVSVVMVSTAILYIRGRKGGVSFWRQLSFWTGFILLYGALHTQLDYYAEREFFVHRLQHMVLHHLGPFLIALSFPGLIFRSGLPMSWRVRLRSICATGFFRAVIGCLMNPIISGVLFVGLIWLWLIPGIHFYAMLDVRLYRIMNWSMAIDGLLFWFLILDPRRSPPARLSLGGRIILLGAIIPPQVLPAAMITLASRQVYPLYALCGRAFGGVSAENDQVIGGLILWIPTTMMSILGALIVLVFWFRLTAEKKRKPALQPAIAVLANSLPAA